MLIIFSCLSQPHCQVEIWSTGHIWKVVLRVQYTAGQENTIKWTKKQAK